MLTMKTMLFSGKRWISTRGGGDVVGREGVGGGGKWHL